MKRGMRYVCQTMFSERIWGGGGAFAEFHTCKQTHNASIYADNRPSSFGAGEALTFQHTTRYANEMNAWASNRNVHYIELWPLWDELWGACAKFQTPPTNEHWLSFRWHVFTVSYLFYDSWLPQTVHATIKVIVFRTTIFDLNSNRKDFYYNTHFCWSLIPHGAHWLRTYIVLIKQFENYIEWNGWADWRWQQKPYSLWHQFCIKEWLLSLALCARVNARCLYHYRKFPLLLTSLCPEHFKSKI